MNSQGKIRSSDFSANDFPGKEGYIWALSIRPNFPAKNIRIFWILSQEMFVPFVVTSRISKFLVEWEAPNYYSLYSLVCLVCTPRI